MVAGCRCIAGARCNLRCCSPCGGVVSPPPGGRGLGHASEWIGPPPIARRREDRLHGRGRASAPPLGNVASRIWYVNAHSMSRRRAHRPLTADRVAMECVAMRILVLTFYYPPDLGAGAPRIAGLVSALQDRLAPDSQLDVITTRPNRYASFVAEAAPYEERGGLSVRRIPLGRHKSGMIDQSFAFARFAQGAVAATRTRPYDIVVATSSRLMTAVLGAWIARKKAKLYLDIRDIFVDTIQDVIQGIVSRPIKHVSERLERFALGQAAK